MTAASPGNGKAHDVLAIGCGPFNLGLVALGSTISDLDLVCLDRARSFAWHPGLMFDDARLQLSFLADLVTLVEPTHPLSFLSYLKAQDRLYPFYIRETFHPTRREYEDYLRWAISRLPQIRFGHDVESVRWEPAARAFAAEVVATSPTGQTRERSSVRARALVLAIGTEPHVPSAFDGLPASHVMHGAAYLERRPALIQAEHVTVVGGGQSGAEIVLDLLRANLAGGPGVTWLTRTRAFAPLDYTKLVLEMTTPDYIRYFHALPESTRDRLVAEQWQHYKGISADTLADLHEALYQRHFFPGLKPVDVRCGIAVEAATLTADGRASLTCRHRDTGTSFAHATNLIVAATGYRERTPRFLAPVAEAIRRDGRGRPRVALDHRLVLDPRIEGRIYVSNADLHSHGVAAPDLGIGAYRNALILNSVVGREVYALPQRTAFTSFPPPAPCHEAPTGGVAHDRRGPRADSVGREPLP